MPPVEAPHSGNHRIVVFGSGSWGTAMAVVLARAGREVCLWARRADQAEAMRATRINQDYLPEALIPDSVRITSDVGEAASYGDVWLIAAPSQAVRALCEQLLPYASERIVVISLAKGIENETLFTTTRVLEDVLTPPIPREHLGVLYGPSHAEEVARSMPTTLVAAAHDIEIARFVQHLTMTRELRIYLNPDVIGVEIGGSVKNVLAIAAGICDGVGYGDNTKAALITRGIAEIRRLGLAMGADTSTFAGLAGIGDLIVTCMSRHSRNRFVGEQIGQGRSLDEIQREMKMVAEGVRTTRSVHELAGRYGIELPISSAVYETLFEGKRPQEKVAELMGRSAKREDWLPDFLEEDA
jgi:glycerol-3-phosphate dehydrogenase (NAD(P)+)